MHEHMSFYKILHISEDAPDEIIKLAYKGLAQKYHPDRYKGPDANDKMVKIREAYEVLSNPEKRKAYDNYLKEIKEKNKHENTNQKTTQSYAHTHTYTSPKKPNFNFIKKETVKKYTKYFFYTLLSITLIGIILALVIPAYDNYIVKNQTIEKMAGLRLGLSQEEVKLLKGKPTIIDKIEDHDGFYTLYWYYGYPSGKYLAITFSGTDKDNLVTSMICGHPDDMPIEGIWHANSVYENVFYETFGKPEYIDVSKDRLSKWISYPKLNAAFEMKDNSARSVCLTKDYVEYVK